MEIDWKKVALALEAMPFGDGEEKPSDLVAESPAGRAALAEASK